MDDSATTDHQPVGVSVPGWVPPPVPGERRLQGRFVDLVPFTHEHVAPLFEATCGPGRDHLWTYMSAGPFDDVAGLRCYLARMQDADDVAPYALAVDGVVQGIATYLRIAPAAGSIEVGSITYGPALQQTAAATEAMFLMADEAFRLGYRRYEWKCDSLNEPSRRAAVRLGFGYEGRFRQALVYKGRNRDTDWYAMTDGDWARLRPAYLAYFDALDADGRQGIPLGTLTAAALEGRLAADGSESAGPERRAQA